MVEEMEKMITKEGVANSSSINEDGSEADDSGDLDDAEVAKALAPPPPRHPLELAWIFWFDNPSAKQKQTTWGSSILPIYTFSFVEDFWSVYNNIGHPSKIAVGADFHCFKNKIETKWEDSVCANGGKWTACFSKGKSYISWLYTFLAIIGEQFDDGDEICGAVVNVRTRQEKIALWTKNAANEAAQWHLEFSAKNWKTMERLLDYNDAIGFIFHVEAKRLDRGANNCYTV